MLYSVNLTREVLIKIDENIYTKEVIDEVRSYWGLANYDDNEVLEWVAENIVHRLAQGHNIKELEGLSSNPEAHEILVDSSDIEVSEAEIKE